MWTAVQRLPAGRARRRRRGASSATRPKARWWSSAHKAGLARGTRRAAAAPARCSIPFESEHQYMATLHEPRDRRQRDPRVMYVKGSVERVLERCNDALGPDGDRQPLDPEPVHRRGRDLAADGLRVLAFAQTEHPAGTDEIDHADMDGGLTFLGLQGMIDPPRPEAIDAVAACQPGRHLRADDHRRPPGHRAAPSPPSSASRPPETPHQAVAGRELAELTDDRAR